MEYPNILEYLQNKEIIQVQPSSYKDPTNPPLPQSEALR